MRPSSVQRRLTGLILASALGLAACSHRHLSDAAGGDDDASNVYPANYKTEILAAMHVYLNDPTAIRDAGIGEPALKPVADVKRYVVCLRYNAKTRFDAKKRSTDYAGVKENAAVFVSGRFDRFAEARETCTGATYAPFPELEKLSR